MRVLAVDPCDSTSFTKQSHQSSIFGVQQLLLVIYCLSGSELQW